MSDIKTPSLADEATEINDEFAAIKRSDLKGNSGIVERAIALGTKLKDIKERAGHGRWEKWLKDHCRESKSTVERYMRLAESQKVRDKLQEVKNVLGNNDPAKSVTRDVFSLRAALAMANKKSSDSTTAPGPLGKYDSAENSLISRLEDLAKASPETVGDAAQNTIQRLQESVVRLKPPAVS